MRNLSPENQSVTSSPIIRGLREAIDIAQKGYNWLGLNDPNSALLGIAAPLEAPAARLERLILENKALKALMKGEPSLIPTKTGRAYAEPVTKGRRVPAVTGAEKAPTLELSRVPTTPEIQKLPASSGLSFESKFSLPETAKSMDWPKQGFGSKNWKR